MPIFTKRIKQADETGETAKLPEQKLDDIQINDFSDNIDLNELGSLLVGGISTEDRNAELEPPMPETALTEENAVSPTEAVSSGSKGPKISDALGTLFKAIAEKFKGKKKRGDIPNLPGADAAQDPNYISETVSFADLEQDLENWNADNAMSQDLPQNQSDAGINFDEFNNYDSAESYSAESQYAPTDIGNMQAPQFAQPYASQGETFAQLPSEAPITYDVYSQPQQSFTQELPQTFEQEMPQGAPTGIPDNAPNSSDTVNTEIFSPQWPDFDDYSLPQIPVAGNYDSSAAAAEAVSEPELTERMENEPVRRPHDIMGAVRARIEQFRRRLPSFKPKVYEVPETKYNEKDDKLAKSPSLMADVERYISSQNDLNEVSQEYEQMSQYIRSVNTDARLRRSDITPPENIHEIYSAQNELFAMINDIGMQNEEQRRRIGVYARPEAEDPYNYRGINDVRQNYTDIESTSFSMSSGISFESEEKISPDRSLYMQQYDRLLQDEMQMDDDFNDSFDDDFDGGFDDDFDGGFDNNFDGGFDNDFDNGFDNNFDGGFDNDFDNDFDDNRF